MVLVDVEEEDAAAGEGAHVAAAGGSELDGVVVEPVELRLDGLLEIDEDEDWGLPRRFRERLLRRLRRYCAVHFLFRLKWPGRGFPDPVRSKRRTWNWNPLSWIAPMKLGEPGGKARNVIFINAHRDCNGSGEGYRDQRSTKRARASGWRGACRDRDDTWSSSAAYSFPSRVAGSVDPTWAVRMKPDPLRATSFSE
ncbi:hypothetical protein GW17_00047688 [Ensete ventricosum]|nr:hypothetical protein GW17_00047688 [Ensete ventricosum]